VTTATQFEINGNLEELRKKFRQAWSRQTSSDPKNWSPSNPAWGQSAATALIVNEIFGGEIVRVKVRNFCKEKHYYNVLPSGEKVDLAQEQFGDEPPVFEDPTLVPPEKLRNSTSKTYFELSLKMAQTDL
jgi:hypothetical protein